MGYSGNSIEDLKNQINIVDVIGRVVQLKRAGANYKGLCPFHNEKTPSFVVSEEKQIFTCFGCGQSGNVIEFTKKYYNLEFKEACEKLARENGVDFHFAFSRNQHLDKYYEVNKEAARFFYRSFTQSRNPAYQYMKSRGLEDSILKKFGIGYADNQWDSLYKHFKQKGVEESILLELGLISKSEKNGKYYDKFRNRVMFPILSTSGKVIGFGGRILGDGEPKYLNSPENKVFQKKNNLYALNLTKSEIGKSRYAILVEGYMDVISLYQNGVRNVSASLGTALTENQAKLIHRYTKDIVLSYDSDQAGKKAALRGIDILGSQNLKVKVLHVDDGKDPDDFIKKKGKKAFLELVDNALSMVDYKLERLKERYDLNKDEDRIDYMKEAAGFLAALSPVEQDVYSRKLANEIEISEGAIRAEVAGKRGEEIPAFTNFAKENQKDIKISNLELDVIKAILLNPDLTDELEKKPDLMKSFLGEKIRDIVFQLYNEKKDFLFHEILERLEPEEYDVVKKEMEKREKIINADNAERTFYECMDTWERHSLWNLRKEKENQLKFAHDVEEVRRLMEEIKHLDDKIKKCRGN